MWVLNAGCPAKGRVSALHSYDPSANAWTELANAPEPGRGGTALASTMISNHNVLLRFGGFAGYELGEDNAIDIYTIDYNTWRTCHPSADPTYGLPGARSVHGFVGIHPSPESSGRPSSPIAILFYGERDASNLGHAGAGTFWNDVWVLYGNATDGGDFAWRKARVEGESPEARGWFPCAAWYESGKTKVVFQGGLLGSNERSSELWVLDVNEV